MRRIARKLAAFARSLGLFLWPISPAAVPGKLKTGVVDGLEEFNSLTVRAERVASLLLWRPLTLYAAPRREADGQSQL